MLKRLIEDSKEGEISVRLTADSKITEDETAYSIIGEIPGATQEVIYMTAHYDGYFQAFEDNASGVSAALGIAKALIDSGYEPQKTIRFIFHPAEEWGLIDSRYDWAAGAYLTINKHLGWAENAFALINMDGGVFSNDADGIEINASWEFAGFAEDVGFDVPESPFDDFKVVSPVSS
jgi:Iap family predicted aminopeptidase